VLNSQFENAEIRARYREYLEALYATDESRLWEFARRHRAQYIFIHRNEATAPGPGSAAWVAGVVGPLHLDMNVVRLHFRPESLRGFVPVYDNEHYRILQVRPAWTEPAPAVWNSAHHGGWRLENFSVDDRGRLTDPLADRARLRELEQALSQLQDRQRAILSGVEERWRRAGRPDRPDLMLLHRRFVQARLDGLANGGGVDRTGRLENELRSRLSEIDPGSGQPLNQALAAVANRWQAQLAGRVGEPLQYATGGQLLALAGRYGPAAEQFAAAAAFYPAPGSLPNGWRPADLQVRLWQEQVWWTLAAGHDGAARHQARRLITHVPTRSRAAEFFRKVAAIPGEFE
jgi:hypothetical protein